LKTSTTTCCSTSDSIGRTCIGPQDYPHHQSGVRAQKRIAARGRQDDQSRAESLFNSSTRLSIRAELPEVCRQLHKICAFREWILGEAGQPSAIPAGRPSQPSDQRAKSSSRFIESAA
jgi:hypothetical protein